MPELEPIDSDGQELNVVPRPDLSDAIGKIGRQCRDMLAQNFDVLRLQRAKRTLCDDKTALPMGASLDEDKNLAGLHAAEAFVRVALFPAEAEPQHIHRRAHMLRLKTGLG